MIKIVSVFFLVILILSLPSHAEEEGNDNIRVTFLLRGEKLESDLSPGSIYKIFQKLKIYGFFYVTLYSDKKISYLEVPCSDKGCLELPFDWPDEVKLDISKGKLYGRGKIDEVGFTIDHYPCRHHKKMRLLSECFDIPI